MAETPTDGIEQMRARMARGRRVPPPARRVPAEAAGHDEAPPAAAPVGDTAEPAAEPAAVTGRPPRTRSRAPGRSGVAVPADAPPVNLAIRVRRPLDDHLVEALHTLRRTGVRSSKVEVIEMLLWELADDPGGLPARLRAFREAAPRAAHAPITV